MGQGLGKFQETRTITYPDDRYIKSKLSVVLQVLTEFKAVFKEDVVLDLNVSKTSILPKGVTEQVVFDVAQVIITVNPPLTHLSVDLALVIFWPEDFVGIGVPIDTDIFVRDFVVF